MVVFLEGFPFPFQTPAGQELWRTLAGLVPVPAPFSLASGTVPENV